ncbi:MAG TPA: short-chain dehydrogenase/reductase [Ramlibacter sp.]|uniref:short-chain dehydrogenase/reductase n=1 Tax=Ramlibacter sp. TaxID=1917967 RepID=UPI002C71AE89|nr:short-chain dehydrogenase/reductase [Ramlibacter sp.]HVZ44920.1 short-chain dehydrogenase/reductase [Ramlibacter sp.]
MDLQLRGKRALITGASRGIGAGVAEALAEEGCDLELAARSEADLRQLASTLAARHGVQVRVHVADLTRPEECAQLVRSAGSLDILVNNAGAIPQGRLQDIDDQAWRSAWELKVFGFLNVTRQAFKDMCERGGGVIVNVIGIAGERPVPNYVAGSMANAGLMAMTRALGVEGIARGVRVVGVNPGAIETTRQTTRWKARALKELGEENRWRELVAGFPRGRLGQVREVADTVAFLASDRSSYTNATIVTVDGGWTGMQ